MTTPNTELLITKTALSRAAREAWEGRIDDAHVLLKTVRIVYPKEGNLASGKNGGDDQFVVAYEVFGEAGHRKIENFELEVCDLVDTTSDMLETLASIEAICTFIPELSLAADELVDVFRVSGSISISTEPGGLAFAAGDDMAEQADLINLLLPTVTHLIKNHLVSVFPIILGGTISMTHQSQCQAILKQIENTDDRYRQLVHKLNTSKFAASSGKSYRTVSELLVLALSETLRDNNDPFEEV